MLRKFLKHFKKKQKDGNLETDSVPESPRLPTTVPVPTIVPADDQVNWNASQAQDVARGNQSTSNPLSQSSSFHVLPPSASPFPSPLFQSMGTPASIQLTISHSHGFHVGEVHNVSVSNGGVVNYNASPLKSLETTLSSLQSQKQTVEPTNDLLESIKSNYERLKDWHIALISDNVEINWKLIGQSLELLPTELAAIELRTEGNVRDAVKDILKSYLWRYPNTSIGFIASILLEVGHRKAVHKLAIAASSEVNGS